MTTPKKPNFSNLLIEMGVCIFIPSMILKKLSNESDLPAVILRKLSDKLDWLANILKKLSGETNLETAELGSIAALTLALSLPLAWGIYEFIKNKKIALIPALGFISILLTGSIGLLKLDSGYIAIKEAAIPFIIGLATLISTKTRFPLVKTFLYNDMVIEVDKVSEALEQKQAQSTFDKIMRNATWMLAGSFFLSATLNYALAKYFITSPSGTAEFNDQLGSMNLWSYPVIVVPSMIVLIFAMFYIFRNITRITGLSLEEIMRS